MASGEAWRLRFACVCVCVMGKRMGKGGKETRKRTEKKKKNAAIPNTRFISYTHTHIDVR